MSDSSSSARSRWSWIFYDWANSAFATTVMAGFFPLFFKNYYSVGTETTVATGWLGVANSIGSLLIAVSAPILGSIADAGSLFKRFLFVSTILGALATGLLAVVHQGDWTTAAMLYVIASVAFGGAIAFYDALLPRVSNSENVHKVSALGYSYGYLGGGVLFTANVIMFKKPELFGLASGEEAVKASFLMVSVWWVLFSIPLFFFVKEKKSSLSPRNQSPRVANNS